MDDCRDTAYENKGRQVNKDLGLGLIAGGLSLTSASRANGERTASGSLTKRGRITRGFAVAAAGVAFLKFGGALAESLDPRADIDTDCLRDCCFSMPPPPSESERSKLDAECLDLYTITRDVCRAVRMGGSRSVEKALRKNGVYETYINR